MSEYTIINIVSDYAPELQEWAKHATNSRFVRLRNNQKTVLLRFGGDERERIYNKLLSESDGKLIYDAPIQITGINDEERFAYVIIDYYEDTGTHHEAELYTATSFMNAQKIDDVVIHDDRTGTKIDDFFQKTHNLSTSITPP